MQWSLFLLILMGHCSFLTFCNYEFHFIEEKKTWDEASKYCKENYTDLATVHNMTDVKRLCDSTKKHDNSWIGLYSNPGDENRMWHWSLPGVEFSDMQAAYDDDDDGDSDSDSDSDEDHENCVWIQKSKLKGDDCTKKIKFICYSEKKESIKKFHLNNNKMTWPKAQNYCREHHTDLVSGCDQLKELKDYIKNKLWIGLFRDTWRWSDGSNISFRNWDQELSEGEDSAKKCATTGSDGIGKWGADVCIKPKPFFCYDDKVILIKEMKTWEEALKHCRSHFRDLVSITNPHQQKWVQERAKQAETSFVWLGLHYICSLDLWRWVSEELVCYDNWASEKDDACDTSGAMKKEGPHVWSKESKTNQFNFICAVN